MLSAKVRCFSVMASSAARVNIRLTSGLSDNLPEVCVNAEFSRFITALVEIGEGPVDDDVLAFGLRRVEPYAEEVEGEIDGDAFEKICPRCRRRLWRNAVAQFMRAEQIGVAPGCRFTLVAELFERFGAELTC